MIGGDAIYTVGQLDGSAPLPPRPFDAHNYRRSLQELKLFHREYPDAIVTPGHDPSSSRSSATVTSKQVSVHLPHPVEDLVATSSWRSRLGAFSTGKVIGSPNWTVTFGKRKRFQRRTPAEPWIATGTTGAPDSSAIRPIPGSARPARRCASGRPRRRSAASRPARGS